MRRELSKALRKEAKQDWIEFEDENGLGFCQPDAFVVFDKLVILVEAKLTWVDCVWEELHGLYRPLLQELFQRPVTCIAACKWAPRNDIESWLDVLVEPKEDYTWHFIPGRT